MSHTIRAFARLLRLLALAALLFSGCRGSGSGGTWISGTREQRWVAMEKHLRGLDVAMVELSYRYDELYWAGMDGNWEYAGYQAEKMRLALDNALERRPKRQASTVEIFFPALERVESAITARDRMKFSPAFDAMTASCNACHAAEGVPTFRVAPPDDRTSSTTRRP